MSLYILQCEHSHSVEKVPNFGSSKVYEEVTKDCFQYPYA